MNFGEFEIIGRIIYAGFDCDGNIHIILAKNDKFWAEMAIRFLKALEGEVVKISINNWCSREQNKNNTKKTPPSTNNGQALKRRR
ncbi:MAG: hypothetical protein QXO15_00110 [Nitrososphaerota archaeon]